MKKYHVFKMLKAGFDPIRVYKTDSIDDAITMAKLKKKEDFSHEYTVMEIRNTF